MSDLNDRTRRRGAALTRKSQALFEVEGDRRAGIRLVVAVTRETTRVWCREVSSDE
jgi:hypothetical protein